MIAPTTDQGRRRGGRPQRPPTVLTVTGSEMLTRALKRVRFRSDDMSAFAGSDFTDRYVKLIFPMPGVAYPEPLDMRVVREAFPPPDQPAVRTYTALFPDVESGTLAIDFVIHGDNGVAGPWAAAAQPGDRLLANGPGGAYRPDPAADWHLLAGDESAVPAIGAALDDLPADAIVQVVVLIDARGDEPTLAGPAGTRVTFAYRNGPDGGPTSLEQAIRSVDRPAGQVQAFVHGEAQDVMHGVRPYLLRELGVPRDRASISGYWRRGRTEEGFREWKSELARSEENAAG